LPEQTLGRGLRRMFFGQDVEEYVSIIGTPAFMEFVESINAEGVELEKRRMDRSGLPITPTVIEVDNRNEKKDIENLDIELPVLTPRIQREYKNLNLLDVAGFERGKISVKQFTEEEKKEIIFKEIVDDKIHHTTILNSSIEPNYQSVVGFFTQRIMKELRLFGCYDILFGKIKEFITDDLFSEAIDLNDANILRNLSEPEATKTIVETFKKEINNLTVQDVGDTEIKNYLKVSGARPFVVTDKKYFLPKKSVFNKIVGDNDFELEFADFLENAGDVVSFAKNYFEIHFKIDYKNASGAISSYYPDFFVKTDNKTIYIVETKGREDLDDMEKIKRLGQWCEDASGRQKRIEYKMIYVKQEEWEKYKPVNFKQLASAFALKG
jgi:type III restriction enzyme